MRKNFKKKARQAAGAVTLSVVACTFIYGTLVLAAAKSMLKMQTTRVDL